jgi:bifunctional non-homologous end joining protein LigD
MGREIVRVQRVSLRSRRAPDLAFTHTEKVLFPAAGITKGDVIDYYRRVAPLLIPHLCDRPMTLERLPDGLEPGAPHFWQKHAPRYYPGFIPRVSLTTERGEAIDYVLVNDVETLLYLVNQGALSFHPWLSRLPDLDHPSYVLFDLDPGAAPFAHVVEVARALRLELASGGTEPRVKTSGKTGLHVLVRWDSEGGYDETRAWAKNIAGRVVQASHGLATAERSIAKRGGRVYVDVNQNARGHHVVPPYVLRPTPEATVSTPLAWDELTSSLDPKRFTLKTIFLRLDPGAGDPMADLVRPRAPPRRRRAAA